MCDLFFHFGFLYSLRVTYLWCAWTMVVVMGLYLKICACCRFSDTPIFFCFLWIYHLFRLRSIDPLSYLSQQRRKSSFSRPWISLLDP
jgi:hypothetical protein